MKAPKEYDIFEDTDCLTLQQLRDYIEEKLPPKERQAVEHHLVDCPLCSEAYDGFIQHGRPKELKKRVKKINNELRQESGLPTYSVFNQTLKYGLLGGIGLLLLSGLIYGAIALLSSSSSQKEVTSSTTPPPSDTTSSFQAQKITLDSLTLYWSSRWSLYRFITTDSLPYYEPASSQPTPPPTASSTPPPSTTDTTSPPETQRSMIFEQDTVSSTPDTSQPNTPSTDTTAITQSAHYPGGTSAMKAFIRNNLSSPDTLPAEEKSTTVIISALVNTNGQLTNLKIVKGAASPLNKSALAVVQQMPAWIPARKNGDTIDQRVRIPVNFQ